MGWFTGDLCCVSLSSPAESSAFPHGLPSSTMPPISPFCLHSSPFSLIPMPNKNHPHHPLTQKHALLKKQGDSWIGDSQASRTNRTKTHHSLFCPPEDSAVGCFSLFPPLSWCWFKKYLWKHWFFLILPMSRFDFKIILTDVSKFYRMYLKLSDSSKREMNVGVGMMRTGQ